MNGYERFLKAVKRQEPDRVPIWELIIDRPVIEALHGDISLLDFIELEDLDGVTIFACCPGCLDKIKADPAQHVKILQEKGETPVLCLSEGCMSGKPCCPKGETPPCARTAEKEVKPQT